MRSQLSGKFDKIMFLNGLIAKVCTRTIFQIFFCKIEKLWTRRAHLELLPYGGVTPKQLCLSYQVSRHRDCNSGELFLICAEESDSINNNNNNNSVNINDSNFFMCAFLVLREDVRLKSGLECRFRELIQMVALNEVRGSVFINTFLISA